MAPRAAAGFNTLGLHKLIYLIGTQHEHQLVRKNRTSYPFCHFLKKEFNGKSIDLFAEESCEDAICCRGAIGSVVKETAHSLKINHLFCEPTLKQNKELGIKCREEILKELLHIPDPDEQGRQADVAQQQYEPVREKIWKEKLSGHKFNNCFFVLGAKHDSSFKKLLSDDGIEVFVLNENWRP